jgi:hypothetical protein
MSYTDNLTRRAVRAMQELQEAQSAVRAAGIDVPMALDSAVAVYTAGCLGLGMTPADLAGVNGNVSAIKLIFGAAKQNPRLKAQMAADSASVESWQSRFPGAKLARSV